MHFVKLEHDVGNNWKSASRQSTDFNELLTKIDLQPTHEKAENVLKYIVPVNNK